MTLVTWLLTRLVQIWMVATFLGLCWMAWCSRDRKPKTLAPVIPIHRWRPHVRRIRCSQFDWADECPELV